MFARLRRNFNILRDGFRQADSATRRRHTVLFMLTAFTVFLAGANFSPQRTAAARYADAGIFAAALLAILAAYAAARYVQARSYGVYASLPLFIPMPIFSPFGTFGVVTRTAQTGVHPRALFDIAFWGPAMSFALSVPCLVAGTYLSEVVAGAPQYENPLFLKLLARVMKDVPYGYDLSVHPLLAAGWAGLFFTAVNLFPLGSLSGGQMAYALFGRRQREIGYLFMVFLFVAALYYPMWFAFVLLYIYLGVEYPEMRQNRQTLFYDVTDTTARVTLDRRRQYLSLICALIFALSFTLRPFSSPLEGALDGAPGERLAPDSVAPQVPGTPEPALPMDENSI